jgi:co-chaperonin GroES (HSP10)
LMRTQMVTAVKLLTEKHRSLAPLHNWVVIERVNEDYKTAGGIIMATDDSNSSGTEEAEVVAAGPGCTSGIRVGDRCKFIGRAIGFMCDGKHYYMVCDAPPAELKTDQHGNPIGAPYIICVIRREETLQ